MSKFNSYKDLKIWMKGIELVKEIYSVTSTFPSEENFGLKQQLRRCAVSIPSNIAEDGGDIPINSLLTFCIFQEDL